MGYEVSEWVPEGVGNEPIMPPPASDDDFSPPPSWPRATRPVIARPRVDLASAGFEALRGLGLSVTQAKRFIAQREERGGLRSPEEIEAFTGFPQYLKRTLAQRGGVG